MHRIRLPLVQSRGERRFQPPVNIFVIASHCGDISCGDIAIRNHLWLRLRSAISPRWLSEVEACFNSFRIAI